MSLESRSLTFCLFILFTVPIWAQTPFVSTCAEDTHLEANKRKHIESVAMNFVTILLSSNPGQTFELFTKEGQANVTRDQLVTGVGAFVRQMEPKNTAVKHSYVIDLKGKSPGRVVCATDLSKPDGWESLGALDVPEQAYVELSAETLNNRVAFTLWLVPESDSWKVQSFWMNASTLADQDSMQLWERAKAEKAKGHLLNAALYYIAAAQTANRGPSFQLGISQSITQEISQLDLPVEIQGQPPFIWKSDNHEFKVLTIGPIAVGGKIYVIIQHQVEPWKTDEQVDNLNKQLLAFFKKRFPEYSGGFAGLVARANEHGSNRGFGTVEELPAQK